MKESGHFDNLWQWQPYKSKLEKDNILSPILQEFSKFSNLGLCLCCTQIISGFLRREYLGAGRKIAPNSGANATKFFTLVTKS